MARTQVEDDPQRYIDREHIGEGLGSRASRSTMLTLMGTSGRFVLQTLGAIILARLLTPEDYGLVGMVVAFAGLAEILRDLGLSTATIQRSNLTHAQVSALFWITCTSGAVIGSIMFLAAPAIADFYGQPELVGITRAISSTFLITSLIAQHQALLARQMRFGWLLNAELSSIGGSLALGVVAALLGAGYWALVIRTIAQALIRMVVVWIGCGWRPSRPAPAQGLKPLLTFGGNHSLFQGLNYVARNADDVIIGRFLGAGALGLYDKAYQLLLLPIKQINGPIHRVAVPTLSYLQDQPERYRRFFAVALSIAGYVAVPGILLLAVLSREVVLVLLGETWIESANLFRILALAGVVQTLSHSNGWLYTSMGHAGRQAVWSAISRPLVVASFFVGLPWGVEGVAWAYTGVSYLLFVPAFRNASRGTPVGARDFAGAVWRPLVIAGCTTLVAVVVRELLSAYGAVVVVLGAGAAAAATYGLAVLLWPAAREQLRELARVAKSGARRRQD